MNSQLCVDGKWNGELVWTRSSLDGESAEAERLLALYEEGNAKAQAGGLAEALTLFRQGLSEYESAGNPDAHLRTAEAALLWGLGTALDRTQKGEEGWHTLLRILSPGGQRDILPLGLAINWSHSATLAGLRHGKFSEVCALLNGMHRLGWGGQLRGADEATHAVRERFILLAPFRAKCFEGLMRRKRFEDAARIADECLRTIGECEPEDAETLEFWSQLRQTAENRDESFRLEEPQQGEGPAIRVEWDGTAEELRWKLDTVPEDPHLSGLARLYAEAAHAADRGDHARALALYDEGLEKYRGISAPRSADGVVRAMMLWGKASLLDQLAADGSPQAWETLMQLSQPGYGVALPLPLLLRWVGSSVIVGTHLGRWPQVRSLLVMLMTMALHPQLGQRDRELHGELVSRFLHLLEGAYGGLESNPPQAADWVRELQRKVEPPGLILLPLRDLLYHALSAASRHGEAEEVAAEVTAWAREQGDQGAAREWESRAAQARSKA